MKRQFRQLLSLLGLVAAVGVSCPMTVEAGEASRSTVAMNNVVAEGRLFYFTLEETIVTLLAGTNVTPKRDQHAGRQLTVCRGSSYELSDSPLTQEQSPRPDPKMAVRFQSVFDRKREFSYTLFYASADSPFDIVVRPPQSAFRKVIESESLFVPLLLGRMQGGDIPANAASRNSQQVSFHAGNYRNESGQWAVAHQPSGASEVIKVTVKKRVSTDDKEKGVLIASGTDLTMGSPGEEWSGRFGEGVSLVAWDETLLITIGAKDRMPEAISYTLEVGAANGKTFKEEISYKVKTAFIQQPQVDAALAAVLVVIANGSVVHQINTPVQKVWVDGEFVDRIDRRALRDKEFTFTRRNTAVLLLVFLPIAGLVIFFAVRYLLRRKVPPSA